jgi:hypothetical protein
MDLAACMTGVFAVVDVVVERDARYIGAVEAPGYMKDAAFDLAKGVYHLHRHTDLAMSAAFAAEPVKGLQSRIWSYRSFEEQVDVHLEVAACVHHTGCL